MNLRKIQFLLLAWVLLSPLAPCDAQTTIADSAHSRWGIRLNLLGLASFNPTLEVEYRFAERTSVFLGGGWQSPMVNLDGFYFFGHDWYPSHSFGLYAGFGVNTPVWRLRHLWFKPAAAFMDWGNYYSYWSPPITAYVRFTYGIVLNLAYAQPIGKHFFVEPAIGIGPWFAAPAEIVTHRPLAHEYWGLQYPVQLNAGLRF